MKHIYEDLYGWRVIIQRSGLRYHVFIANRGDHAAALQRAVVERDHFLAVHKKARSNTGICGISETVEWKHNRPHDCFSVTFGASRKNYPVRFHYRGLADRSRALRAAVAHRARLAGEDAVQLLTQALP